MTLEEYITRSTRSFEVLLGLIWPKRLIQFLSDYGLLFIAAIAVAACLLFLTYIAVKKLRSNQLKPSEVMIAVTAVWGILIVSTVQVRFTALSVFPNRYFSGVDVALIMSLTIFIKVLFNKNRYVLMNGLIFVFVLSNLSNSFQFYRNQQRHYLPNALAQADTVLIEIGLTSPLGSITWEMEPSKLIYADFQTNILKSDSFWDSLPSDVIAYASVITYDMHIHGNNLENRQEILERFKSKGFSVLDTGEYAYGLGYVYILKR
jgi:hypothetical protein